MKAVLSTLVIIVIAGFIAIKFFFTSIFPSLVMQLCRLKA